MPSGYPGVLDSFVNPTAVDNLNTATKVHHDQHTNLNDAVKAIEIELGILPKGTALSVRARLDAIDVATGNLQLKSDKGNANGYAGLDISGRLAQNVDASKIVSGTVALARLPSIPGANVLGATGGGSAIPLDAVPNLPASRTTSGVFDVLRIPDFDAAKIITGTISAARLPSSVTSNANSQVVADSAARNAIPMANRVDGMLVTQRTPFSLWVWRADNSTWNQIGGSPGTPVTVEDPTDYLALSNTTFAAGTNCGVSFTAPASGGVIVDVAGHLEANLVNGICYLAYEIRTGASIGAGSVVVPATTELGVGIGSYAGAIRSRNSAQNLHLGLTPATVYHVRAMHLTTSGNFDIFARKLLVIPVTQ